METWAWSTRYLRRVLKLNHAISGGACSVARRRAECLVGSARLAREQQQNWQARRPPEHAGLCAASLRQAAPSDRRGVCVTTAGWLPTPRPNLVPRRLSPMHWCAGRGHVAVLEALLSARASIFVTCDMGELPIHLAVANGQPATMLALLEEERRLRAANIPLPISSQLAAVNSDGIGVLALAVCTPRGDEHRKLEV